MMGGTRDERGFRRRKEITLSRNFERPVGVLFEAWTNPKQFAEWWGAEGYTNPVCSLDLRPGGLIRIEMRGPDGTVYPVGGMINEIAPAERIVFSLEAFPDETDDPGFESRTTATFIGYGGSTTVVLYSIAVISRPELTHMLERTEDWWRQSLDRLAALLNAVPTGIPS